MSLVRFYPLSNVDSLHRQINQLFDELTTWDNPNQTVFKPAIELIDDENNLTLRAIVPGIDKKDFDISVSREAVKISGEYRHNQHDRDKGHYISEFNYGKFERTIKLPIAIQNNLVKADYTDGILTLTLPKVEEAKNKVYKVELGSQTKPAIEAESEVNS